jgi:hypothetical protein
MDGRMILLTIAGAAILLLPAVLADPPASLGQLSGLPVPGFAVERLEEERFRALHRSAAPRGQGERWTTIPWEPDLGEARERAAREGKPLLMWVMDGHPLGCT